MASPSPSPLEQSFDFDTSALVPGSAASVKLTATSQQDVALALVQNKEFPSRPGGVLELGSARFAWDGSTELAFGEPGGKVTFGFGAGANIGAGVFDAPGAALRALKIEEVPGLDTKLPDTETTRYLVLNAGYMVQGNVKGSHPIGVIGSIGFGAEARRTSTFAVMHRFDNTEGSATVMGRAIKSWRLPRQFSSAGSIEPGTWLVSEVEGSVALNVAAKLGYDFSYVRETKLLGLSGDIGLKVQAGLQATFGFTAGGRFLMMVGRETTDPNDHNVRLRMFRMKQHGISFGLNLSAMVQGQPDILPHKADDLIKAVFGVHGQQIVKDLKLIEEWTDPDTPLSVRLAGLTKDKAFKLLKDTTGIDPEVEFNKARKKLLGGIAKFEALPAKASGWLWSKLDFLETPAASDFKEWLELVADPDLKKAREAVHELIADTRFGSLPAGEWLTAIADKGILELASRIPTVQAMAQQTLKVLDGTLLKNLKANVDELLDIGKWLRLDGATAKIKETDFKKIDTWLLGRLEQFFEEKIDFTNIEKVRATINSVIAKRQEIYEAARKALSRRYDFQIAAAWQKDRQSTALIDATFDLSVTAAAALYREVIDGSGLAHLMTREVEGVKLGMGLLTHTIKQHDHVDVRFPSYSFRQDHDASSIAKIAAKDDNGRVLVYELDASDQIAIKNRLRSELALSAGFNVRPGSNLRQHDTATGSISYELVFARENIRRTELEALATPFIEEYLADLFSGEDNSVSAFFSELDATVSRVVGNRADEFGDVLARMEVFLDGSLLQTWMRKRSQAEAARDAISVSRRLQVHLKRLVAHNYFLNVAAINFDATSAAVLAYAAIPVSSKARLERDGRLILNTSDGPYWDTENVELRQAMLSSTSATAQLGVLMAQAERRLVAAGRKSEAKFFAPSSPNNLRNIRDLVLPLPPNPFLRALLNFEARVVTRAAAALEDLRQFTGSADTDPMKAVRALAEFGFDITGAFHAELSTWMKGDVLRTLGPMLLLQATQALGGATAKPAAMLSLTVLKEERKFKVVDFLANKVPSETDVAVAQRLVQTA